MYFFDTTTKSQSLAHDADFWVGSNTTYYPLADKARSATEWTRKAAIWIWQACDSWQFDDTNYSTLPWATTDLVDLQQDVTLPTTAFKIDRCAILDSSGNYHDLIIVDKSWIEENLNEYMETAGLPTHVDLTGASAVLYPKVSASSVTLTAGFKIWLARDISPFTASSTTVEPGFHALFHRIVSVGMALDYAIKMGFADKQSILKKMLYGDSSITGEKGLKGELQEAYASRDKGIKNNLRVATGERV